MPVWHVAGTRHAIRAILPCHCGRSLSPRDGRSIDVYRQRFGFRRALAALALIAGLATMMATGAPASASTTTVTIHKAWCSTTANSLFDECHGNRVAGIGFTIGGRGLVTNGSGVTG